MSRVFPISLSVALLVVAGSVGYYFVFALPHSRSESLRVQEAKNQAELATQNKRNQDEADARDREGKSVALRMALRMQCIDTAEAGYQERWEKSCKALSRGEDCGLPSSQADSYDRDLQTEKEHCIKLTSE